MTWKVRLDMIRKGLCIVVVDEVRIEATDHSELVRRIPSLRLGLGNIDTRVRS